ncbi:hypothetical protein ACFZAR_44260 [Streptomyces sp. NPDC008222]|uniref:hypothetical protein n=1 Tax=Streptomyces sp. NPDC008222 TaxID=3364820 RepID=UPI0036E1A757
MVARGATGALLPENPSRAAVHSFGYTHRAVNGATVQKGRLDFYYKGTGDLLCTDGERLASPVKVMQLPAKTRHGRHRVAAA